MKLQEPDIPKYTKIQVSQVLEISLLGWGNSVSLFGGTKLAPSHSCRMWVSMDGIGKSLSPGHNYVFVLQGFALQDKYIIKPRPSGLSYAIHGDPNRPRSTLDKSGRERWDIPGPEALGQVLPRTRLRQVRP